MTTDADNNPATTPPPTEPASPPSDQTIQQVNAITKRIVGNVEKAIVGKRRQILLAIIAWYCEGHILLEDVPGVAKTMLARALSKTVGCTFRRVQCTPDLLPTDVTGTSIFNQKTTQFEFRPGPIFAQTVLADEVNRATPRTQASLLEAMGEGSVTIDGTTHALKKPFLVIATQNPVDHEGTFPLPEAQLDRFFMKFSLGYPSQEDEIRMLDMLRQRHPVDHLQTVVTAEQIGQCQRAVRQVYVDRKVAHYITSLVGESRDHDELALGGSPRASIALYRASQAMAAAQGRGYVLPDDVKRIIHPVMGHRVIVRPESRLRKVTAAEIIDEIVDDVAVPVLHEEDMPRPAR